MQLLAVDPGAERLGWAVLRQHPLGTEIEYVDSGILGLERGDDEPYQEYKLRLINYWAFKGEALIRKYHIIRLVSETQPAVGGGNFIAATQSELAKTAITVIQTWAFFRQVTVSQIGSTSVKAAIGGKKDATKAKVRNGVIKFFPELAVSLKKETTGEKPVWDRSDALATGLAHLGVKVKT